MAVVVEQHAGTLVHGRMVVELHQVGVGVAGVRIDGPFDIAFGLGPQVAGVEGPLAVPGPVELEFDGLVGALGTLVTVDFATAAGDVAVLRAVEGHVLTLRFAPQRDLLAGIDDWEARGAIVDEVIRATGDVVDPRVLHRPVDLAIGGIDAIGPGAVDRLLEAQDVFVLEYHLQVPGYLDADIVRRRHVAVVVDRSQLRAEYREQVGVPGRVILGRPAVEQVVGVFVGGTAAEVIGQLVGQRQVVATGVAEHLGEAIPVDIPAEADARRDHVTEIGLSERPARGQLVVELVGTHAQVQQEGVGDVPDVLDVERRRIRGDRRTGDVAPGIHVAHAAGRQGHAVDHAVGGGGRQADHRVTDAVAGILHITVGIHDLPVDAEAQQVVAEGPFEIEAGGLALVIAQRDAGVRRMAAFALGRGAEHRGVAARAREDAAVRVPVAVGIGAALVHAVHGLGDEVVRDLAGVGDRPVATAGFRVARPLVQAASVAGEVVAEGVGRRSVLVGERQELQAMAVVQAPIDLGSPEVVVAAGLPHLQGIEVGRIGLAPFHHREDEEPVPDQRAGRPQVGLVEAEFIAAGVADVADLAVGIEVVLALGSPRRRLDQHLHAAVEFVAARTGHGVDHAAGGAAEFGRVAAGLDLHFLEEVEGHRGKALAPVRVGDVEAIDVGGVLGHRRAAEGQAAEGGAGVDDARCEQGDRAEGLVHGESQELFAPDVGGRLGRIHVHPIDDARAFHLHGAQVGRARTVEVDRGRAAQRNVDGDRCPARGDHVVARRQLADAVLAVAVGGDGAAEPGGFVGDRHLRAGLGLARHGAGDALRQHRRGERREAQTHRHAEYVLAQVVVGAASHGLSPSGAHGCCGVATNP